MKILVDSCMAGSVPAALGDAGHDVECVGDWPADPGDAAILQHAARERQVVLTLDKDFGELAVVRQQPHAGIIRLVGFPSSQQAAASIAVIVHYAEELADGALVTAEQGRTRVRPGRP